MERQEILQKMRRVQRIHNAARELNPVVTDSPKLYTAGGHNCKRPQASCLIRNKSHSSRCLPLPGNCSLGERISCLSP